LESTVPGNKLPVVSAAAPPKEPNAPSSLSAPPVMMLTTPNAIGQLTIWEIRLPPLSLYSFMPAAYAPGSVVAISLF
jgi:hypothetical protein